MQIYQYIILLFIGYIIGRIGDRIGGHWNTFHHWIYGLILIVIGIVLYKGILYFGAGIFISDFNDFLHLRFYGPDKKKNPFWGFD